MRSSSLALLTSWARRTERGKGLEVAAIGLAERAEVAQGSARCGVCYLATNGSARSGVCSLFTNFQGRASWAFVVVTLSPAPLAIRRVLALLLLAVSCSFGPLWVGALRSNTFEAVLWASIC